MRQMCQEAAGKVTLPCVWRADATASWRASPLMAPPLRAEILLLTGELSMRGWLSHEAPQSQADGDTLGGLHALVHWLPCRKRWPEGLKNWTNHPKAVGKCVHLLWRVGGLGRTEERDPLHLFTRPCSAAKVGGGLWFCMANRAGLPAPGNTATPSPRGSTCLSNNCKIWEARCHVIGKPHSSKQSAKSIRMCLVYICMCVCTCGYIYIYMHMHMYLCMCIYVWAYVCCVSVCVYIYVYPCVYMHVCIYICVYLCVYTHVYVFTCVYICMCVYVCDLPVQGLCTCSLYVCVFRIKLVCLLTCRAPKPHSFFLLHGRVESFVS